MEDRIPSPAGISLIGAIAVVVFYWIHLALLGETVMSQTGVELTLFISAFLAQYIPLAVIKSDLKNSSSR